VAALFFYTLVVPNIANATTVTCSVGQSTVVSDTGTVLIDVGFAKTLLNDANLHYLNYNVTQSEPLSLIKDGQWQGDGCLLVTGLKLLPRCGGANPRVYFIQLTAYELDGTLRTASCAVGVATSSSSTDMAAAQAAAQAALNSNVRLPYRTCIDGFSDKRTVTPDMSPHDNVVVDNDPGQAGAIVAYDAPIFVQTCKGKITLTTIPNSGTFFPCGVTTVTCTATDAAGQSDTMSFTVTVNDVEPPVMAQPPDITEYTTEPDGKNVSFTVTATDNCPDVEVVCTPESGSLFPLGSTTVTCIATDAADLSVTKTFLVIVNSVGPLSIATHANMTVANDLNQAGAVVTFSPPSATGTEVTVNCAPASGSFFPVGATTVVCTATDASNASATSTFTITVNDTQDPTIAVNANMTVSNDFNTAGAVVTFTAPAASDNTPGVTVTCSPVSGSFFAIGTTTVTCTARDASNNTATSTFTVRVNDMQNPTIGTRANIVAPNDHNRAYAVVAFTSPTATDNSPGVTVTCAPSSGSQFNVGVTTVFCTARDASNNTATSTFTITVNDVQPPTIATRANIVVSNDLNLAGAKVIFNAPSAADNCPSVTVTCVPASNTLFPVGVTTVTCTARDTSGNTATSTFTVTVNDTQKPTIAVHANMTVPNDPDQAGAVVVYAAPAASDNCPGVTVICVPASGTFFAIGTTTVTCTARDASNNTASSIFIVTVVDDQGPTIADHDDMVVSTDLDQAGAVVNFTAPAASDNLPGVSVVCVPASSSFFPVGLGTVVCTATDSSGNSASSSFTITVNDTQAPSIAAHVDVNMANDHDAAGAVVVFVAPAATDNSPGVSVACVPASGSFFAIGTTTVTCTALDAAGNSASSTFTVTVFDNQMPVIGAHDDIVVGNDLDQAGAVVVFNAPTASDNAPGVLVVCEPESGSFFPVGMTTVLCSAHDAAGNVSTMSFTVTVNDTQKPVISIHDPVSVSTDPDLNGAAVHFVAPAASDNVPGVSVSCAPASGSFFVVGSTMVTCTALDAAGNSASSSFIVTVSDTQKPTIAVHDDMTVPTDLDQAGAVVAFNAPAALDNCPGVSVSCVPASGSFFALGSSVVTCTALDAAGNSSVSTFIVTVVDVQNPTIAVHDDISVTNDHDQAGAVVNYVAPAASDNCPGVTVICVPASGTFFAIGTTTVTCTARDASNNTASSIFIVTVVDDQGPTIADHDDMVVSTDLDQAGAVVNFTAPAASDNLPGVSVVCVPASSSFFPVGLGTVVCTATDSSGNSASSSFTITVNDTQAPSIAAHVDVNMANDHDAAGAVVVFVAPAATDNSPGVSVACVPASGSFFAIGTTTVTCTALDAAGNSASSTFTVTVFDNQMPVIGAHDDIVVGNDLDQAGAVVVFNAPTASDNAPGVLVVCEPESGSFFPVGMTTVLCSAHDAAGNVSTMSFTVTVNDTQKPVISIHDPVSVSTDPDLNGAAVHFVAPAASDNVSGVIVSCAPASGSFFAVGNTMVICTALDAAGNSATSIFTVSVVDTQAPTIAVHADIAVGNDLDHAGAAVVFDAPEASDNCPGVSVSCAPASGSFFTVGVTTVICAALDAAGNNSVSTFLVTVNDTQKPVIDVHADMTVTTDLDMHGAVVSFVGPAATDNCPGVTVSCIPTSSSFFAVGDTVVMCTAMDAAGNSAVSSFTVTVNDTQKPSIAAHADMIVSNDLDNAGAAVVFAAPTATDNCPGVAVTCSPASGAFFPIGTTTVTCTARDASNNTATSGFTVTVNDTQKPTIATHADMSVPVEAGKNGAKVSYTAPAASDNCPGVAVSCSPASGSFFEVGVTTVTCTATDKAGNTSWSTFKVTVTDIQKPVATISVATKQVWPPNGKMVDVGLSYTASDNCPGCAVDISVTQDESLSNTGKDRFGADAMLVKDAAGKITGLQLRATRDDNDKELKSILATLLLKILLSIQDDEDQPLLTCLIRILSNHVDQDNGRVYLVILSVTDCSGNVSKAACSVVVPKSQSKAHVESALKQGADAALLMIPFAVISTDFVIMPNSKG
jgi:hypothetical protein